MFRKEWAHLEEDLAESFSSLKNTLWKNLKGSKSRVDKIVTEQDPEKMKQEFIKWGQEYAQKVKDKAESEKFRKARDNFYTLLRNLGINERVIIETFQQNKKEILDPLIGESVALVAVVLGWSQKDRELFSQSLGEIGVAGLFAAKPFLCLIAICGLAYGYQEHFHAEAFKKGGVLGLAGIISVTLSPGGFVGLLTAVIAILYLNKKLKVDRPIETQLKEIFQQIRSGAFFKEVRGAWGQFEAFISKIFKTPSPSQDIASH